MEDLLRFSFGNAKLPSTTAIFDLPAGYTCPGARKCRSRFDRKKRKIVDGKHTEFRCYAATQETQTGVAKRRDHNYNLIKTSDDIPGLLINSLNYRLERKTTHVRWHSSGDFFSYDYAKAILLAAEETPDLTHYFYTKSLLLFLEVPLPSNVFLTASWGGKHDKLIEDGYFPRNSRVVYTEGEAAALGLAIDHDDSHAHTGQPHAFCHLVHGTQPKGSVAGQALALRRKENQWTGYGKQRQTA